MSVSAPQAWQIATGTPFSASLVDPAGLTATLGARLEFPVTRAIAAAWQPATLSGSVFTVTLDGPVLPGPYQLVWMTNDNDDPPEFQAFVPLFAADTLTQGVTAATDYPTVDPGQVRPTVLEVSKLEHIRTVDGSGAELGIFTEDTSPTAAEVDGLIDQAVDDVLSQMREAFDPVHYPQVKRLVAFYVAEKIEAGFYREQAGQRGGPSWDLKFQNGLEMLNMRIEQDLNQQNLIGGMEPRQGPPYGPPFLTDPVNPMAWLGYGYYGAWFDS